jgi:hypothetical protein
VVEIFSSPIQTGPTYLLCNRDNEVKRLGCCVNHSLTSKAEVKDKVELYFYTSLVLHGWLKDELCLLYRVIHNPSGTPNLVAQQPRQTDSRVDISSTCKVGQKLGSASPSVDMLPFDGTFAGYCAAEVGNPRGTY